MQNKKNTDSPLRFLPAVDTLLKTATAREIETSLGTNKLTDLARTAIEDLRRDLIENRDENLSREILQTKAENRLREHFEFAKRQKYQRVINATGVIIHTNLGRAPFAESARRAISETAANYCSLEYDLETGKRGRRGQNAENLLCELTGAEAALIVNNCAAAAFLVLSELGKGGEAIVSRGELVEIGGDFRVPDVMAQSGTKLVEVGTTNRTKIQDFETAVTENTNLFVRVHPSNFRIVGFTAQPDLAELAQLAHSKTILLYEDAGSGALIDLSRFGLNDEPVISESIKAGVDIVTFSGDKLLGGCQAGLIVGRAAIIERLRKNPLYRALRVDKIAYAVLAATLEIYQKETYLAEIPVLRMLAQTKAEIEKRALGFVEKFQSENSKPETWNLKLVEGTSAVGGGSAPLAKLPTILISIQSEKFSATELERSLRFATPPIVARIADDKILLDLRTVSTSETAEILSVLDKISAEI